MPDVHLKEVKINRLFGYLNHEISFMDGGVTFIHGANGCGKTTALRLIRDFFELNTTNIASTNFATMEFLFSDGYSIEVARNITALPISSANEKKVRLIKK